MPKGKGTYGKKKGRPAKKNKKSSGKKKGLTAAQKKLPPALQKAMMKKTGIGPGIAISFMFRDVLETPQGDPKIFKYRPASRFAGVTKKKALSLLNLSSDSSVGDCENINTEIEKY